MYAFILFTIIAITIIVFIGLIILDRSRCKQFINGTWIDRDGNLLIMKISGSKILISFGVNTENDEYELSEKEYKYSLSRIMLSRCYKIKVSNGISISIDYISGVATVYNKKKKIGKFAKNNLIAFD